jgi:hypothetical protein
MSRVMLFLLVLRKRKKPLFSISGSSSGEFRERGAGYFLPGPLLKKIEGVSRRGRPVCLPAVGEHVGSPLQNPPKSPFTKGGLRGIAFRGVGKGPT